MKDQNNLLIDDNPHLEMQKSITVLRDYQNINRTITSSWEEGPANLPKQEGKGVVRSYSLKHHTIERYKQLKTLKLEWFFVLLVTHHRLLKQRYCRQEKS